MAEAVSFVSKKLGELIVQEAKNLYGVEGKVDELKKKLSDLQCFLKDADAKMINEDESVKKWVRDIRDRAYESEDIIDTFMLKVTRRRRKTGFFNSIKRCLFIFNELIAKQEVFTEIEKIKKRLEEMSKTRVELGIRGINEIGGTSNQPIRRVQDVIPSLPELHDDKDVVGFGAEKETIVNQLVDESNKNRSVISIVGIGGLGKTTLAKSIYSQVKSSFPMHAWVTVSQEYKPFDIIRKILKQITQQNITEEDIDALRILRETLEKGKYLIVLDDVWRTDVWAGRNRGDGLKNVFPDVTNGSRVIITTRDLNVASFADPTTKPHELRLLNKDESWELFLRKAFPRQNIATCCPEDLEDVAHQLVDRCDRLPLALVVLGGLMSTKGKDHNLWKTFATEMTSWQHVEGGKTCLDIPALSYDDLPYYLKPCFLYFGLFPKDYDISVTELCRLWTAEGFFSVVDGKTLEETAKTHIEELVQRCMVQVTESRYDGNPRSFRVHNLFHDMCISKAKDNRVFEIYNDNIANDTTSCWRLVVCDKKEKLKTLSYSSAKLRGIFSFDSEFKWLSATCSKFLRVIYLYGVPFTTLPIEIKSLIHLRYLGLKWSKVKEIPSWIGNLYSLQTIDVRSGIVEEIPDSLWEIESLRHVCFIFVNKRDPPKMKSVPKNLQTLQGVFAGPWIENVLPELTNLCKLYIKGVSGSHANALFNSLQKLGRLLSLHIDADDGVPSDNIIKAFSKQNCLKKLHLNGPFINKEKLPSVSEFPKNLMKIILIGSDLEQDPMPTLEKLPYLKYLKISGAYKGKHMTCSTKGFPQLLSLVMNSIRKLEEWKIEKEAMPSLKVLRLSGCSCLKMIPEGLRNVTTLDELLLLDMPVELETRIKENTGEDWDKIIKHVRY